MTQPTTSVASLLALLHYERANLLTQFASTPEALRVASTGESGWSAAQIIEHCARVEGGVARMIAKGAEMPRTATADELQAAVLTERTIGWVRERSTKVEAPERVRPTGTLDADAALAQLQASRAALLEAFATADNAVLDGVTFPHPFIGPLTLRSWVELTAHHDARHAAQMKGE
ncbi:DinB family protein [Gemmatimonas sp.]|uniref:DinB family protein n=1 Tax=Gemmatimonas sp. TaxID=1962908 RepID=UPI0035662BA9